MCDMVTVFVPLRLNYSCTQQLGRYRRERYIERKDEFLTVPVLSETIIQRLCIV